MGICAPGEKRMGYTVKQGKKSILFEWAGSYLIVLVIPLITIFLNYYLNMETIREEIYNANEIILDNLGNEIDRVMDEQKNIYNQLYIDQFFASWVSHREKNAEFYSDASRVVTQVGYYLKYSSDIDCIIYMEDENYIIYNSSANNAKHIYLSLSAQFEDFPEYDDWIALLSGDYNNEFLFEKYLNHDTNRKCLVYADRLALKGNKPVNVFVSVPMDQIAQLTAALDSKAYLVMVYGDSVEVIGDEEDMITPRLKELICSGEGIFETEEYMGIVTQSSHKGFSYCMLITQSDFWTKSTHIRNVFLISIIVTLLVAFGAVSYLLRRNFMPVSRLLEKVSGERTRGNEFYQIELAYSRLKNENKSMQQILQGQKEALLGSYLLSVMKGRRKRLSGNEIAFFELEKDKPVILCGFQVTTEDELLRFAVDNVFSELMEGERFSSIEDGNYMLYLFFVEAGKEEEFGAKCDERIAYMYELFREKWEVSLEFHRTTREKGLGQLEKVYQRLMEDFAGQNGEQKEVCGASEEIRGIVADVLEYVEEHYNDSALNISTVADSINKNPKYISRVFKETMGEGILDYVNRIRITKAKEIIATRRYSTEEAGTMVGYASNQTFRRAFMKIVGMTPGKYMESLQSKVGGRSHNPQNRGGG